MKLLWSLICILLSSWLRYKFCTKTSFSRFSNNNFDCKNESSREKLCQSFKYISYLDHRVVNRFELRGDKKMIVIHIRNINFLVFFSWQFIWAVDKDQGSRLLFRCIPLFLARSSSPWLMDTVTPYSADVNK